MKYFKVKKKGKTKGRPSKEEKILEDIYEYWFENHKEQVDKVIKDALIYGTGMTKFKRVFKS